MPPKSDTSSTTSSGWQSGPIVRIAGQPDGSGRGDGWHVRAGDDDVGRKRCVQLAEHRARDDGQRRRPGYRQEVGGRPTQVDHHAVSLGVEAHSFATAAAAHVIERAVDVRHEAEQRRRPLRIHQSQPVIDNVLRRDWRTVAEGDAGAQVEDDLSAVLRRLPGIGQRGLDLVVEVESRQPLEDLGDRGWPSPMSPARAGSQVNGSPPASFRSTPP